MGREINLWSLMNSAAYDGRWVTEEDMQKLTQGAAMSGQEISIKPYSDGWRVRVFSCYDGAPSDWDSEGHATAFHQTPEFEIVIPVDGSTPSVRKVQ